MENAVKGLAITAITFIIAGAIVVAVGAVSSSTTPDDAGADIGGGIAVLFGSGFAGLGLLFGLAAGSSLSKATPPEAGRRRGVMR